MKDPVYLRNGSGALLGAMLFCPAQVPLPLEFDDLREASLARWPGKVEFDSDDDQRGLLMWIEPGDETGFNLNFFEGRMLIGLDGLPEQNLRLAAWLRSLMPATGPRVVVTDDGLNTHAELPFGVTPEELANTMVDHSVDGWDDDDPDFLNLYA